MTMASQSHQHLCHERATGRGNVIEGRPARTPNVGPATTGDSILLLMVDVRGRELRTSGEIPAKQRIGHTMTIFIPFSLPQEVP